MVKRLAFFLFLLFLGLYLTPFSVSASQFTSAYLRLSNQSANSNLSGTVCAAASSAGAGTENKVSVIFPSDFTISSTASNWTTSTTNLPENGTAWPGIGATATSVSGQTVTFASNDLSSTTLYCFNFTGASSTTGSSGTEKTGTITSKNSSDAIIDSTTYATAIIASNNISITAGVDPQQSDLPVTLECTTSGTTFAQNTTISYRITYGSNTAGSIPLTIQAEWSQGTIEGSAVPSVDILDYVVGSASQAYGSTSPVIDTTNRTITWTISSFPGGTTGQTVTFSLKTNSNYTGSSKVDFTVSARATSGQTTTPDSDVTRSYLYSSTSPTATPTSGPSSTSTPTPTPTPLLFAFSTISVYEMSQNEARIQVVTNKPATLTLEYGSSPSSFSKKIQSLTFSLKTILTISDLDAGQDYYFKVTAKDEDGKTIKSDLFTFKTAEVSETPSPDLNTLVVVSNNTVILNPQARKLTGESGNIKFIIPYRTVFIINFALQKRVPVKSLQAIVQGRVLGISTFGEENAASNFVNLIETKPGVYTGRILSPDDPGNYDLYVKVIDYKGNIKLQKVAEIRVVNRFMIIEKGTKKGVEGARVLLYILNPTTKIYEEISPQILPIDNPSISLPDGSVSIVLPRGKYRAEVSAVAYNPQRQEFNIDFEEGNYPTVVLDPNFSLRNILRYYASSLLDALDSGRDYLRIHSSSNRLFDFSTFGAIFIFVIISILSVSARTHVNVFYLPYFLAFKTLILFKKHAGRIIFGKVLDSDTNFAISKANVTIQALDGQTVANLKTNKLGEFYCQNRNGLDYKILVSKDGFQTPTPYNFVNEKVKEIPFVLKLKHVGEAKHTSFEIILIYFESILGILAESLIVLGVIVEIFFVFTFGFLRVAPFIAITILNFLLIFLFLYKPRGLAKD